MNTTRSIDNKLEKWSKAEQGRQEATKEDYRRDFTRFFDWLANDGEQVETVQQSDITAYVTQAEDALFLNQRGSRISRQGAWTIVRGHGIRVGLGAELTPHVPRHSCATHMLLNGADIRYIQELLGHRSISSTQRYTPLRDEELREVCNRSHPRAEAQEQDK